MIACKKWERTTFSNLSYVDFYGLVAHGSKLVQHVQHALYHWAASSRDWILLISLLMFWSYFLISLRIADIDLLSRLSPQATTTVTTKSTPASKCPYHQAIRKITSNPNFNRDSFGGKNHELMLCESFYLLWLHTKSRSGTFADDDQNDEELDKGWCLFIMQLLISKLFTQEYNVIGKDFGVPSLQNTYRCSA